MSSLASDNILGLPGMLCTISAARERGYETADEPLHVYGPPGLTDYIKCAPLGAEAVLACAGLCSWSARAGSSTEALVADRMLCFCRPARLTARPPLPNRCRSAMLTVSRTYLEMPVVVHEFATQARLRRGLA